MKKNIKVLYDGAILSNYLVKNSNRSGILVVAINVLSYLLKKKDLQIDVSCTSDQLKDLNKINDLNIFPTKLNIINNSNHIYFILQDKRQKSIARLTFKRQQAKQKHRHFRVFTLTLRLYYNFLLRYIIEKIFPIKKIFSKYDVYLSPVFEIPKIIKSNNKIKKMCILYDLIPYVLKDYNFCMTPDSWFGSLLNSLSKDEFYFFISEYSRQDFLKYFPVIDKNNTEILYLACDEKFKPRSYEDINKVIDKYDIPRDKKYMFSLCSLEPRKNLVRIIRTFIDFISKNNINDVVYILGGGIRADFFSTLEKEIPNLSSYKDKIIKIGYVDDEDLPYLYSGAEWFVYTSQYEGFGLPPLEAMSCGCPVITSNNSSLPEVVGDAGIMIDWDNDEQHVKAYETYYYNQDIRETNIKKGLQRAKMFSWEKCGDTIYNKIKSDFKRK